MMQTGMGPLDKGAADAPSAVDDPRISQALEEYLAALEAGQRPDRRAFLSAHADVASALAGCLDSLDMMHAAAPQLKPVEEARAIASNFTSMPLGDFRILREIGRGGMGVVYEAVQLSLDRRVALKVLPFAAALDPKHLHRFKNEAQAAAHLHHTNIVPVYAVGCERGVYYYAMQFIEGKTLASLIHDLRRAEGLDIDPILVESDASTRSGRAAEAEPMKAESPAQQVTLPCPVIPLPLPAAETVRMAPAASTEHSSRGPAFFRTMARFGVQAAEALEHAHQQGIIHRDVKPANLLLDDQDHLWIADFGLARSQNDAGLTTTGDLVGTIRYMSPEQALAKRGLIDHRTDIYSLGATLYEGLTLEPVFSGSDRQEVLRQIASDDPRPPRSTRPGIPRELETIVLKSLAKTPEERYGTAQELADDLRRFLEDRPILARRPTWPERTAKWLRRHRGIAVSVVAILVLAVVGLTVSTIMIAQEQARTHAALQAEADQRARAEANFKRAREVLDYLAEVGKVDMAGMPEAQEVRRKLLEAACNYYQEFIDQHPDDPSIAKELAESHVRMAGILSEIGSQAEALAAAERARQAQERLSPRHPAVPDLQRELSSVYQNLGSRRGNVQGFLLAQKSVQDDLKLTEEQRGTIGKASEQRREAFRGFRHRRPEEWGQIVKDQAAQDHVILSHLLPEQSRRLAQIALQHRGPRALTEPDLAATLKLTDEQKQRMGALLEQAGSHRPGPRSGWKRSDETSKGLKEQLLGVLTEEQKAKWKELTGEPFTGEIRYGPPGGRGPPPWADRRRRP